MESLLERVNGSFLLPLALGIISGILFLSGGITSWTITPFCYGPFLGLFWRVSLFFLTNCRKNLALFYLFSHWVCFAFGITMLSCRGF